MDDDRIIIRDKYGHSKSVHALQPKTAKDLMETEIVKPDEIVKGLLPVGASILAGEPKCGKSFIVMQMVLAVAREKMIDSLMQDAREYGFDGINLDFEGLRSEAGPHYVQFIRELSIACRKEGIVLSIDNYVPSAYTEFYNRREQGIVADYVIIMGYDEHYAGGEAGPVSSISFVDNGIKDTLEVVPKEKVINAIPFYTRLWTTDGESQTSQVFDMEEEEVWISENQLENQLIKEN